MTTDDRLIFENYKKVLKEANFPAEGHEPGQRTGPTPPGENAKGSWAEPEDFPYDEQPEQPLPQRQDLKGWALTDNSYNTKGSDPTQVTNWHLTKGNQTIEIEEFFGDFCIIVNGKEERRGNQKESVIFVNERLKQLGAPTVDQIGEHITAEEIEGYDSEQAAADRELGDPNP